MCILRVKGVESMLGTLINTGAIIVGAVLGLLMGKKLPQRLGDAVIQGFSLLVIFLGVSGAMAMQNAIVVILSIAIGTLIGEAIDIQKHMEHFAERIQQRFGSEENNVATGMITATLLFCTGAMAILGALQGGLQGDHTMLMTKAVIDLISAIFLAASLGIGVLLSAAAVLVYQGSIVLLAMLVGPFLSTAVVTEMGAVGSLLLIGLGLNILGASKLRLMNYIPAIFLPILLLPLLG